MLEVKPISWLEFQDYAHIYQNEEKFFKKMRRGLIDDKCTEIIKAAFYNGEAIGFIATKHFRGYSNLKWVVTTPNARGKGGFRAMCDDAVLDSWKIRMDDDSLFTPERYFRVSINGPALGAYRAVGFKVCGEQRGNCYLSAGRLNSEIIDEIDWTIDETIEKWRNQKPRGGCIVKYEQAK